MLRRASADESRLSVVGRACVEVGRPILFAIAIIIIVFLPLFTLQGVEGKTFRPLAYTVALAMLGSLVFALFVAPMLASLLMRSGKSAAGAEGPAENRVVRALGDAYQPLISHFVHHRAQALGLAGVLLAVGAFLFPRLGSEFTPELQEGTMVLRLTMAPSISLNESTRITLLVERRLMKMHEIEGVVSRIGRGEVGAHTDPINSAEMYIILRPHSEWRQASSQGELQDLIRDHLGEVPGVLTNFTQPIAMTIDELMEGVRSELAVKLFGDDLELLKSKAEEVAAVIGEIAGAADVQVDQVSGTPQLLVRVDRQAIARYGINVASVQEVIGAAIGGQTAGQVFEGVRRFDILVRFAAEYRTTREDISQILVHGPEGLKVPLSQLATIEEIVGPRQVTRENSQRFIAIQCNVTDRDIGSFVEEARKAIDARIELPPGYLVTWGGQFRNQQRAMQRLSVIVPLTVFLIFIVLYSAFNSLSNAVLIILNIPFALTGGIVALFVTGLYLSVPATVGFIALFGVAVLNGVVMVSCINQLRQGGMVLEEAVIHGARLRLRPVLMTALVASLGLVPLLLSSGVGSEVQRPLATVVVGGLFTSTLLTLLVLPTLYGWLEQRTDVESV